VEAEGGGRFLATMRARIGLVAATFKGRMSLHHVIAARSYTLAFEGHGGLAGFARGTADITLEPRAGGTEIRYVVEAFVGGRIVGQLGQPLINGVVRRMAADFFDRFAVAAVQAPREP
jgi:uncharacterized protein